MRKYATLKELGEIITGNTPKTSEVNNYSSDDIPFFKPSDLHESEIWQLEESENYISNEARDKARIVPKGTVLCTCIGIIGKIGITTKECAFNQQINAVIPDPQKVNQSYLAFAISSMKHYMQSKANAAVVPIINKTQFSDLLIRVPFLDEQLKIARHLKLIERLIANRQQALSILDTLVKSRFIEMFGDPVTNPMGWENARLSELGELNRGVSKHRPRNAPELLNGPYPLVQTGDVANADTYIKEYSSTYSEIGLKQSRMWSKGTLCITIAANIAKTGILTFDACFPDSVVGFVAGDRTNQIYIHHWFSFFQKILEEQAPQSAQKNINLSILSNLIVMLPPLALQNQFADFVALTDKSKLAAQKSIDVLQTMKASLMQEYFG